MDAEITRSETTERARLLRIRSYDVDLDFTRGPQTFGSTSLIRFDCRRPGATTHADLIAPGVREITLNGAQLDPAAVWADGRITLTGLADRNELRVVADCAYSSTGLHRTDSADGRLQPGRRAQAGLRRSIRRRPERRLRPDPPQPAL
jgi:aminopeptidase N